MSTCPVHSDIPLMPLQLVKDAERRLWVIKQIPTEPQPKPLPPQSSTTPPVPREGDSALCQEVTGECMWSSSPSVYIHKCEGSCSSADCPDHLMLFRQYVSRKAAGKARAILEGVGLDSSTIDACFSAHPLNDEEIVQVGLVRWRNGQGSPHKQPPTWEVLISAMEYAGMAQQHIKELKGNLHFL